MALGSRLRVVGSICVAIVALTVNSYAQKVSADWKQIGEAGEWSQTVAMTGMNGDIWSIEADGTLFQTDKSGHYEQIGPKGFFKHASTLEGLDGLLYTIEGGTLFRTDPANLNWQQVGK